MDIGRVIYITVLVAFFGGGILWSIFGKDEPEKPPPPEIDLSDVPHWDDDEATVRAKMKRMRERAHGDGE